MAPITQIDRFRALVDEAIRRRPVTDIDSFLPKEQQQLGLGQQADAVADLQYERIARILAEPVPTTPWNWLYLMRCNLIHQEAFNVHTDPYEDVLAHISQAQKNVSFRSLDDEDAWLQAIDSARAVQMVRPAVKLRTDRHKGVAWGITLLRAQGFRLRIEDVGIGFEDGEMERLVATIEADLQYLGGPFSMWTIFAYLRAHGRHDGTRYTAGRTLLSPGAPSRVPSLPVGYLLHLAARQAGIPSVTRHDMPAVLERLFQRAAALCAVIDVEPYSHIENMFLAPQAIPSFVGSNALFDHLFAFRQWSPCHAKSILKGIFGRIEQAWMLQNLGWTLGDAMRLADIVLVRPFTDGDMVPVPQMALITHKLAARLWSRMAPAFVHRAGTVNAKYRLPNDAPKADLHHKPLLEMAPKTYVALPAPLAMPAFFEAIHTALREGGYPKLDDVLADTLEEDLVPNEFRTRGYLVDLIGEKYRMFDPIVGKTVDGECDVVIETDHLVVFIETKKKALRRVSSTGNSFTSLLDLSASLIRGQCQTVRHERLLRQHGHIDFLSGKRLELRGRQIDRIVVTLLDHGSCQDPRIAGEIYRLMAGATVTTPITLSGPDQESLDTLNDHCQTLAREAAALDALGVGVRQQQFNNWFMSVAQLLVILDLAGSPGNLLKQLNKLRCLTHNLFDLYREAMIRASWDDASS